MLPPRVLDECDFVCEMFVNVILFESYLIVCELYVLQQICSIVCSTFHCVFPDVWQIVFGICHVCCIICVIPFEHNCMFILKFMMFIFRIYKVYWLKYVRFSLKYVFACFDVFFHGWDLSVYFQEL